MFSSLLPLRSKESVTGGLMVKPLVQSQLQSVVVNATGRCDKVLSGLSETFTRHVLTMTIHPEAQTPASHVLVEIRWLSYFHRWHWYETILKPCAPSSLKLLGSSDGWPITEI